MRFWGTAARHIKNLVLTLACNGWCRDLLFYLSDEGVAYNLHHGLNNHENPRLTLKNGNLCGIIILIFVDSYQARSIFYFRVNGG